MIKENKTLRTMNTVGIAYKVLQCSNCPGNTEYYCESCPCDLCLRCKEKHVKDLKTAEHVGTFGEKINPIPTQEICVRHPNKVYEKYCEICQIPVCVSCSEDNSHRYGNGQGLHRLLDINIKRQQYMETIHTIRSEALFNRPILLARINADFKLCHTKLMLFQSQMIQKSINLKELIDVVQHNFLFNVFCDFDIKTKCSKQAKEMTKLLARLQKNVQRYEQSAIHPLSFISFIKRKHLPFIYLELQTCKLSMTKLLNRDCLIQSLCEIEITEGGLRRLGNRFPLKLMSAPAIHKLITVKGVHDFKHISCVTSDCAWVNDHENNLILTNTTGVTLHYVMDLCSSGYGSHTVNSESELIYINRTFNINKLLKDRKTTTTIIKRTDFTSIPQCVTWSPCTGDLLIGMCYIHSRTGKVARYNQSGQLTQTIQHHKKGWELFRQPIYITENNNGDVVVSDDDAVVVTDRCGIHRFSYNGRPPNSKIWPLGICTDALSHILVCDGSTNTVQMLNENGRFLKYLLIRSTGSLSRYGLSYNVNTHCLWVGLPFNNTTMAIYRYIERQNVLKNPSPVSADVIKSLNEIPTTEAKKAKEHDLNQATADFMESIKKFELVRQRRKNRSHLNQATADVKESLSQNLTTERDKITTKYDCLLNSMSPSMILFVLLCFVSLILFCFFFKFISPLFQVYKTV
ncbi:uncharacterized protein LOC128163597 [Crassostrea angulata]|uniref:uncharacterized protein LOC128163597 n=1 Tax=Magallana angulata TaxID=2784310 RepID=UPI0022B2035D|nr:uncharacterized protein LOC128163597 [Crassostrea angulata]